MKMKLAGSSRRRASGLTLVEVVVATGLLGTVLASILIATGRVDAQGLRARRRIEACRIADGLLEAWWSDRGEFPRNGRGTVAGEAGWTWRTRRVTNEDAGKIDASVVALEVFGPNDRDDPAVRVEVVLAKETHEEAVGTDAD